MAVWLFKGLIAQHTLYIYIYIYVVRRLRVNNVCTNVLSIEIIILQSGSEQRIIFQCMYLNEGNYTGTVCSELSKIADYTLENLS